MNEHAKLIESVMQDRINVLSTADGILSRTSIGPELRGTVEKFEAALSWLRSIQDRETQR